jgi:hypothetical protein
MHPETWLVTIATMPTRQPKITGMTQGIASTSVQSMCGTTESSNV